jgi:hypothetical protein
MTPWTWLLVSPVNQQHGASQQEWARGAVHRQAQPLSHPDGGEQERTTLRALKKQRRNSDGLKGCSRIFIPRGNSPQSSRQGIHVAQLFVSRQTASLAEPRPIFSALGGNSPQNYHQRIQIAQLFVSEQTPVFCGIETKRPWSSAGAEQKETRTRRRPRAIFLVAPAELTTGYGVDFTNQRFAVVRPNRILKFLAKWSHGIELECLLKE